MSEARRAKARECMNKLHERRRAMGICIYCSAMIDDTKYSACARCRAKKREATANSRERLRQLRAKCEVAPPEESAVPEDHKCWTCVWSKFEGDRFFCPLVGTCVKDEEKEAQEE